MVVQDFQGQKETERKRERKKEKTKKRKEKEKEAEHEHLQFGTVEMPMVYASEDTKFSHFLNSLSLFFSTLCFNLK